MKGINLPFALWLASRVREPVWAMFHEVALPWGPAFGARHNGGALVQRVMASFLAGAAERVFVSVPAWNSLLRRLAPGAVPFAWLPIPSTVPDEVAPELVEEVRRGLGVASGVQVVGHFGTFGRAITDMLDGVLAGVLERSAAHILLLGRGATAYRSRIVGRRAELNSRVSAREKLSSMEIAALIRACDVVVQPFPDGVSTRRTSMMASLALGRAIVTNVGPLSEEFWGESGAVALAAPLSTAYAERVLELLQDPSLRAELATTARNLYQERFALERVIDALCSP